MSFARLAKARWQFLCILDVWRGYIKVQACTGVVAVLLPLVCKLQPVGCGIC